MVVANKAGQEATKNQFAGFYRRRLGVCQSHTDGIAGNQMYNFHDLISPVTLWVPRQFPIINLLSEDEI